MLIKNPYEYFFSYIIIAIYAFIIIFVMFSLLFFRKNTLIIGYIIPIVVTFYILQNLQFRLRIFNEFQSGYVTSMNLDGGRQIPTITINDKKILYISREMYNNLIVGMYVEKIDLTHCPLNGKKYFIQHKHLIDLFRDGVEDFIDK